MTAAIIVSLISAAASIIGVVITTRSNGDKIQKQLEISQAVQSTKLDSLAAEVRQHNEFGRRIPVLEEKLSMAFDRIEELEREVRK